MSKMKKSNLPKLPTFQKIAFMGDILRVFPDDIQPTSSFSNYNTCWLFDVLSPTLYSVTNIKPIKILWGNETVETAATFNFDSRAFYDLTKLAPSVSSWQVLYNAKPTQEQLNFIKPFVEDTLVIGFELSPFLKNIFNLLAVPFLTLDIHPVRFLKDYGFRIEANFLLQDVAYYTMPKEQIDYNAKLLQISYLANPVRAKNNSVLLCGQVEVDGSLITATGIATLEDYELALADLSQKYETIYFKPHPYNSHSNSQIAFLSRFNNVEVVYGNVYRMLASQKIAMICAISSSVLTEAEFFGKPILPLLSSWKSSQNDTFYTAKILSSQFWQKILFGKTKRSNIENFSVVETPIKTSLNVDWSKEENTVAESLNYREVVRLGEPISFSSSESLQYLKNDEWWEQEGWGIWAKFSMVHLNFKIAHFIQSNLILALELHTPLDCSEWSITIGVPAIHRYLYKGVISSGNPHTITFRLPAEYYHQDIISLCLEIRENSLTTVDVRSNIGDTRKLGIGLVSMAVDIEDGLLPINFGQVIKFKQNSQTRYLLKAGWHIPEQEGIWSSGQEAIIAFRFNNIILTDVQITLIGVRVFMSGDVPHQTLRIKIVDNIIKVVHFSLEHINEAQNISFIVPRGVILDNIISFSLNLTALDSPNLAGISEDRRLLGVFLKGFKVDAVM